MKLILFFLLATSRICEAQEAPKRATTIIIKDCTFRQAMNQLLDQGYSIEKYDSVFKTIRTDLKDGEKEDGNVTALYKIFLDCRIKDSNLIVTGHLLPAVTMGAFKSNLNYNSNGSVIAVENKGMKGSELKMSWIMMNKFALSFKNSIEYVIPN